MIIHAFSNLGWENNFFLPAASAKIGVGDQNRSASVLLVLTGTLLGSREFWRRNSGLRKRKRGNRVAEEKLRLVEQNDWEWKLRGKWKLELAGLGSGS